MDNLPENQFLNCVFRHFVNAACQKKHIVFFFSLTESMQNAKDKSLKSMK